MKGYWLILAGQAQDEAAQATYARLWQPIAVQYQAKIRVLNPGTALLETSGYTRVLVVEFESHVQALACYQDPAYQAAKVFARQAGQRELLILEGEPPQS